MSKWKRIIYQTRDHIAAYYFLDVKSPGRDQLSWPGGCFSNWFREKKSTLAAQDCNVCLTVWLQWYFIVLPPSWYSAAAFHKIIFIKYVPPYLTSNKYQIMELLAHIEVFTPGLEQLFSWQGRAGGVSVWG